MKVNEKIIAKKIQGEMVLLNTESGDYFSLNSLGTEIFECISKGMQSEDITGLLFSKYNVEFHILENDVTSIISKMFEKNILIKTQRK